MQDAIETRIMSLLIPFSHACLQIAIIRSFSPIFPINAIDFRQRAVVICTKIFAQISV